MSSSWLKSTPEKSCQQEPPTMMGQQWKTLLSLSSLSLPNTNCMYIRPFDIFSLVTEALLISFQLFILVSVWIVLLSCSEVQWSFILQVFICYGSHPVNGLGWTVLFFSINSSWHILLYLLFLTSYGHIFLQIMSSFIIIAF